MQNQNSSIYYRVISVLLYIILVFFVLVKGAIYFPDSYDFLDMAYHRSIGYKSFLKIFTFIFEDYFEIPVILVQTALLFFATYYLTKTIRQLFNTHYIWLILLQLIILAPVFLLYFVANTLLSEGLTYPLFLIFCSLVLKAFVLKSNKQYYYSLLVLFALILTRGQFIAMVPVLLIIIALDSFSTKFSKEKMILMGVVVLLPFISGLTEKIYNKAVYGLFERTPFSYVSLIAPAFYVADADDYKIYENPEEQEFFTQVYQLLDSLNLSKEKVQALDKASYTTFHANYSKICNLSVHETGKSYFEKQGFNKNQQLIAVNDLCGSMVFPLIKANFKDWLKLYFANLKNAFGSGKQLLLFLMLLVASSVFLIRKKNTIANFIFVTTLIVFANMTIVPLAVHSIKRYLFYTDWILFAIIILLLNEVFTKNMKPND